MFVFGHIGITVGIVRTCDILMSVTKSGNNYQSDASSKFGAVIGRKCLRFGYLLNGIKRQIGPIDYRLVLLGSLLPDIIDKPVWLFVTSLNSDTYLCGRDYAHTLLFNLVLFIGGMVFSRYGKSWLLTISLSSFMHLILDHMWSNPAVLLWPLLGPLPRMETTAWFSHIIDALLSSPEVYVPEIIGLVLLSFFAYRLVMRKRVAGFIRGGAIGW